MPRYWIDMNDGEQASHPVAGQRMYDAQAACDQAVAAVADLARDEIPARYDRQFQAAARDEEGRVIFTVSLSFSFAMRDDEAPA